MKFTSIDNLSPDLADFIKQFNRDLNETSAIPYVSSDGKAVIVVLDQPNQSDGQLIFYLHNEKNNTLIRDDRPYQDDNEGSVNMLKDVTYFYFKVSYTDDSAFVASYRIIQNNKRVTQLSMLSTFNKKLSQDSRKIETNKILLPQYREIMNRRQQDYLQRLKRKHPEQFPLQKMKKPVG